MNKYPSPIRNLIIGSREEMSKILVEPTAIARYVVSIGDPSEEVPLGYEQHKHKIRLEFNDIIGDPDLAKIPDLVVPQIEHVKLLVRFAWDIKKTNQVGDLLINCSAGLSRSPSCAIILLRSLGISEEEAIELTFQQRPQAFPNQRILRLAASLNILTEKALEKSRRTLTRENLLELFP